METHEESVTSYRPPLWVRNLITDEWDPDIPLEYRTMEKVQKPSISVCYTPSSEPFRIYNITVQDPGELRTFGKPPEFFGREDSRG
jgi:hypothetical protein